jgi:N6-L-threonylcarbamoyladenine synthase
MRLFVAVDTSTDHLALALGDLDRVGAVVAARDLPAPRAANTVLLLEIEELLASAGHRPSDLTAVACGRGPGSFTGVRIGVATAKGMAHGLGVPLVGFSTLAAVAHRVSATGLVGIVGDAMRGEVYPALFRVIPGEMTRLDSDRVARPDVVAADWAEMAEPLTLAGNGLAKHRETFESVLGPSVSVVPHTEWTPDGAALVAAAWERTASFGLRDVAAMHPDALAAADPALLLPIYTRLSDAEEAERQRSVAEGHHTDVASVDSSGVAGPSGGDRR